MYNENLNIGCFSSHSCLPHFSRDSIACTAAGLSSVTSVSRRTTIVICEAQSASSAPNATAGVRLADRSFTGRPVESRMEWKMEDREKGVSPIVHLQHDAIVLYTISLRGDFHDRCPLRGTTSLCTISCRPQLVSSRHVQLRFRLPSSSAHVATTRYLFIDLLSRLRFTNSPFSASRSATCRLVNHLDRSIKELFRDRHSCRKKHGRRVLLSFSLLSM